MIGIVVLASLAAPPLLPAREVLGERGLRLVAGARQVEAFRLERGEFKESVGVPGIRDLSLKSRLVLRDAAFLSRLARVLSDDATWGRSSYGEEVVRLSEVAFRFEDEGHSLEVMLCLACGLAAVRGEAGLEVPEIKAPAEVLDLALEAFPDDRQLLWIRAQRIALVTPADVLGPALPILSGATEGEALALEPRPGRPRELADLRTTGTRAMNPALVARLAKALQDAANYELDSRKRCVFVPNVAFRVREGPETAEIILCFGCSEMVVNVQDASGRPIHLAGADFRGDALWDIAAAALGEAELQRILKQARP